MEEKIRTAIKVTVKELGIEAVDFVVEHPTRTALRSNGQAKLDHGDYSANVALVASKITGRNPQELAEEIVAALRLTPFAQGDLLAQIKVAGPGFINFYLNDEFLARSVGDILDSNEAYGKNNQLKGQKIFLEHTQPNPFKQFHIGHLMNNTIGESLGRLFKANGAEVKVCSYHGDVGLHVAKAVYGLSKLFLKNNVYQNLKEEIESNPNKSQGLHFRDDDDQTIQILKKAYAYGHDAYTMDEQVKREVLEINKNIYSKDNRWIDFLYDGGRDLSLRQFEIIYKTLDSNFDYHFFESEAGEIGKKIVTENVGKVFEESEGAVVFKGENFEPKTHTRVFLNSQGLPTYEAKEVGLARIKKEKFAYNQSMTVTANEQDGFFKVVEVAIGEIFPELKGKLKHLSHGMLRLPSGKMSSRTGEVITAESLIDDVKAKVLEKMKESEIGEAEKNEVAEMVSIAAIKYSILKQSIGKDIIFDFDKSLSFEGDSGPYLQYTAVRTQSVLSKGQEMGLKPDKVKPAKIYGPEKLLYRFPEVVARAAREYAPSQLVTYLIELASSFNSFYAVEKIADQNISDASYRLALAVATGTVIRNGLNLLGIKTPSRM